MEVQPRRLAAILVTDVVGYSAMMAADDEGTLSALQAHRNATDPVILNHGGRIVKSTGDGILVEFPTATAAVTAAAGFQDLMRQRNEDLPASRRVELRLGIDLGEVMVDEDGDIFGDGVNIAARIEALADPGGISITDSVYQAVRDRVDAEFANGGEHDLKNIPRPVQIWKMVTASEAAPAPRSSPTSKGPRTLATIAVLPFDNMSHDANQDYFTDGITEDLITALSYNEYLAVVARNSTFAYKGRSEDIRSIARQLDATHVIEGSARRSGDRVRVTAQLIDAETGHHVWAERYDRHLQDIFAVQDELVDAIATKLGPTLWDSAGRRRSAGESGSFDAWDLTIQGQHEVNRNTREGLLNGIRFFDRARELEPDFAGAIAASSIAWFFLAFAGWRDPEINPWARGKQDAEKAYAIESDNYQCLTAMTFATGLGGNAEEGEQLARRLIDLNPHRNIGFHVLGAVLAAMGRLEEAIDASTNAWRLGQHEPIRFDTASDLGYAHYLLGNDEAALEWGKQSTALVPEYLQANILLAATYAQLGRLSEGQRHVNSVLALRPDFSCAKHRTRLVYSRTEDRDRITEGLLIAGFSE